MTARFAQNQGNTRGHRPRLQTHSNFFTAPMTADHPLTCWTVGAQLLRLRAAALALRGAPLQFSRPTSARIVVFIEQQEPVCNDSSNATAPWEHDFDEWRALPGGGLPAHHAGELARNGTNQTAQA